MRKHVFLLMLVLLVGCAKPSTTPAGNTTPLPGAISPNPTGAFPPLVIPTPDAGHGVVTGQLMLTGANIALPGLPVYLAQLLPVNPGPTYMITVQEKSSPHTVSSGNGRFALSAPPGDYVFMIWTPVRSRVITNPATKSEWKVTVKAGETIDAGKIEAEWP